ncbi:MAG: HesA/MoeB/ThiF family protein [Myxococcota bacterium]
MPGRFDRQELWFGAEGQERLRSTRCAIVGVGGLGAHVVQQLAHLGVGGLALIDHDLLDETSRNRFVGGWATDPVGTRKVELAARMVELIDPGIPVTRVTGAVPEAEALAAITACNWVFGCLDNDSSRLLLLQHCASEGLPMVDLASDILVEEPPPTYGGRVCVVVGGGGCPYCLDLLDREQIEVELATPEQLGDRERIYGVKREHLRRTGPSVVSINGAVASLGVTEFLVEVTGVRRANKLLTWRAHLGIVSKATEKGDPDCYYCGLWRG